MAYSVDWEALIVSVPQSDLIYLAPNRYKLDLDEFRRKCRSLEANNGLSYPPIIQYYPAVDTGDVILGRVVLMVNGYQLELEDTVERYTALFDGANTNIHNNSLITNGIPTPNNSAGLQDLSTLLASAYQGKVVIDVVTGQPGTSAPLGTFKSPSGNVTDAISIAIGNGIKELYLNRSTTIANNDLSVGYKIVGGSPFYLLNADPSANLTNCSLENLSVIGEMDGLNVVTQCSLGAVTDLSGFVEKTAFSSTVSMNGDTYIYECYSQAEGLGFAEFLIYSFNLIMRDFHGSVKLASVTGGVHSIEINGGRLVLDTASCTGGVIYARGKPFDIVGAIGAGTAVVEQFDRGLSTEQATQLSQIHGQVSREIYLDTTLITTGNGYQQSPYNDWSTAIDDAETNGITSLVLMADALVDRNIKNFLITGVGLPTIDSAGYNLKGCKFRQCKLEGSFLDSIIAQKCLLLNNAWLSGWYETCALSDISYAGEAVLVTCVSNMPGTLYPTIIGSSGNTLQVRGYVGSLEIEGIVDLEHSIGGKEGRCIIGAGCTGGIIHVRGSWYDIIDNSGAGCTVLDEREVLTDVEYTQLMSLPSKEENALAVWNHTQ